MNHCANWKMRTTLLFKRQTRVTLLSFLIKILIWNDFLLVGFSLIMKVSFQRTKREDFYTHYFIGALAYVVISRHFILKLIIWRLSLWKNNYPLNFIDSCIKSFLNKLYRPNVVVPNVPKRNVFVKLPFLLSTSFQIWKKLQKLFSNKLTSCNLEVVFMSPVRVKSFFTFKGKLPKMLLSGFV